MVELAEMAELKQSHTISLPLSSMDGTKEIKLVVVMLSSETVSEKASNTWFPLRHVIRAEGLEPIH